MICLKGKRFDAAEKHFHEKEVKIRQEIRQYIEWMAEVNSVNSQLTKENEQLKKENADLKEKFEKLLEHSKLSESDITTALYKDKALTKLSDMMGAMERYL